MFSYVLYFPDHVSSFIYFKQALYRQQILLHRKAELAVQKSKLLLDWDDLFGSSNLFLYYFNVDVCSVFAGGGL